jgi:hypothetical protein
MRRNQGLFRVGQSMCGASLTAMLVLPCLGAGAARQPATAGHPNRQMAVEGGHVALLAEIWDAAWGLDYAPNESGLVITAVGDGEWFVLVTDAGAEENPFVGQGLFLETGPREYLPAFDWDQDLLDEAGLLGVEHYFVPGVLQGSTGWEHEIAAMVTEVLAPGENPGDDPVFAQVLAPVGLADDPDALPILPKVFDAHGSAPWETAQANRDVLTPDDDLQPDCAAIWQVCRDGCWAQFIGDARACGLIAAGCVGACLIACSASTFAYGVCVAICSAGCLAIEAGCLAKAQGDLDACTAGCDAARMLCEPGWVPPAAE